MRMPLQLRNCLAQKHNVSHYSDAKCEELTNERIANDYQKVYTYRRKAASSIGLAAPFRVCAWPSVSFQSQRGNEPGSDYDISSTLSKIMTRICKANAFWYDRWLAPAALCFHFIGFGAYLLLQFQVSLRNGVSGADPAICVCSTTRVKRAKTDLRRVLRGAAPDQAQPEAAAFPQGKA